MAAGLRGADYYSVLGVPRNADQAQKVFSAFGQDARVWLATKGRTVRHFDRKVQFFLEKRYVVVIGTLTFCPFFNAVLCRELVIYVCDDYRFCPIDSS